MKHLAILLALLAGRLAFGGSGPTTAFDACSTTAPCSTAVSLPSSPTAYTNGAVKVFAYNMGAYPRTFYAEGPNSGTWTATIGIVCSHEGSTWSAAPGDTVKLSISNVVTDANLTVVSPCTIYGMYLTKTGTITAAGSTNMRSGVIAGVNGGF